MRSLSKLTVVLRQGSQMIVVIESTGAAETETVLKIGTETETVTGKEKILTGGTSIGLPPRTTGAISLVGIGMSVITGLPGTETGPETIHETVTGKTLVDQMLINDLGLKSFCPGLLHQGMCH